MRIKILLADVTLAALALGAGGCSSTPQTATSTQPQAGDHGGTYLTGSYLKQDVQQNGRVNNSVNNVDVIDRTRIERSGMSNARDVLIQQGAIH